MAPAGILALDLARTVGWAFAPVTSRADAARWEKLAMWGHHELAPERARSEETVLAALSWFDDLLQIHRPHLLIIEAPLNRRAKHLNEGYARLAIALVEIASALALRYGAESWEANHSSVKLLFTGNGAADKALVAGVCRARGLHVRTPDEADALALLYFAIYNRFPPVKPS